MYSSIDIAQRFIDLAEQDNKNSLTPMQLIKLVYIAHGYMLGIKKRPLISEKVEAWRYGPVVNSLYQAIKDYRSTPVAKIKKACTDDLDEEALCVIERVYQRYGRTDGIRLSALTHKSGTPWDSAQRNGSAYIPNDLIENYYTDFTRQDG